MSLIEQESSELRQARASKVRQAKLAAEGVQVIGEGRSLKSCSVNPIRLGKILSLLGEGTR